MHSLVPNRRAGWITPLLSAIAILAFLFSDGLVFSAESDHKATTSFLEQYKPHLESWERILGHVVAQGSFQSVSTQPKKPTGEYSVNLKISTSQQKVRIDITSPDSPGWESSIVSDSSSTFAVSRGAETAPYRLDEYRDKKDVNAYEHLARRYGGSILKCPIYLGPISLRDLIESPGFVVDKLTRSVEGGDEMIRVDFTKPASADTVGLKGWFALSGHDDWGVREFEHSSSTKGLIYRGKGSVQYRRSGTSHSVPEGWHYQSYESRPSGKYKTDRDFTFMLYEFAEVPDSVFQPESFGLGNFALNPRSAPSLVAVLFGVAIALLSLGILLRWTSRRLKTTVR